MGEFAFGVSMTPERMSNHLESPLLVKIDEPPLAFKARLLSADRLLARVPEMRIDLFELDWL